MRKKDDLKRKKLFAPGGYRPKFDPELPTKRNTSKTNIDVKNNSIDSKGTTNKKDK